MEDMVRKRRSYDRNGENHHNSKLTFDQVHMIRSGFFDGMSRHMVAEQIGVSEKTIQNIMYGPTWKGVDGNTSVQEFLKWKDEKGYV